jgi:S1-C subfamily serine protease
MDGEVVGITTATLRVNLGDDEIHIPQSVNYAVKSAYIAALLSSLPDKGLEPLKISENSKLEDIIPKVQDSIVHITTARKKHR